MVSDVLSESVNRINDYLDNDGQLGMYSEPTLLAWIRTVVSNMDALRKFLDIPPGMEFFSSDIYK